MISVFTEIDILKQKLKEARDKLKLLADRDLHTKEDIERFMSEYKANMRRLSKYNKRAEQKQVNIDKVIAVIGGKKYREIIKGRRY